VDVVSIPESVLQLGSDGASQRLENNADCSRSPRVWAATRAASAASTGASGKPVEAASTWAWQARSR
jgi:hypothetical protein